MNGTSRAAPEVVAEWLADYARAPSPALRDKIVEAHLFIAELIARRFSGRGVEYDDLYQVASLALVKALDRFDPSRGVQFASFVTPTMVGEVKNYFRDKSRAIRQSRRGAALRREIDAATDQLAQTLHRMPRVDELAEVLAVPEDAVLEAMELVTAVPLDAPSDDGGAAIEDALGAPDPGYAAFDERDALARAMAGLTPRQREIVRLRFYENLSQREVAARLGVSQMTVSRTERRAIEALREGNIDPAEDKA